MNDWLIKNLIILNMHIIIKKKKSTNCRTTWRSNDLLWQIICDNETIERLVDVVDRLSSKCCNVDNDEGFCRVIEINLCPGFRL
jgi:hypothetical protein